MQRQTILVLATVLLVAGSVAPASLVPAAAPVPAWNGALDVARQSLLTHAVGPAGPSEAVLAQLANLGQAEALLAINDRADIDPLDKAVALSAVYVAHHVPDPIAARALLAPMHHDRPSAALTALFAKHAALVDDEQRAHFDRLDAAPPAFRAALTHVVDAFMVYEEGNRLSQTALDALPPGAVGFAAVDAAYAPLLMARQDLLAAAVELQRAVEGMAPVALAAMAGPVNPVFTINGPGNEPDSVRTQTDVALLIDLGGSDVYTNNAGGSRLMARNVPVDGPDPHCMPAWCHDAENGAQGTHCSPGVGLTGGRTPDAAVASIQGAAAMINVEAVPANDDRYGGVDDDKAPEPLVYCGVMGGGYHGAGFLFDAAGDDRYIAGPAAAGRCIKLGTDVLGAALSTLGEAFGRLFAAESSPSCGANGGGLRGAGFLVDVGGKDYYADSGMGTNGGGSYAGSGFLLDVGNGGVPQDPQKFASSGVGLGVNGGAHAESLGFLMSTDGADSYDGDDQGSNGGGDAGRGFLLDAGDEPDTYTGSPGQENSATNGGANAAGGHIFVHVLFPQLPWGENPFGFMPDYVPAVGFLFDRDGTGDEYRVEPLAAKPDWPTYVGGNGGGGMQLGVDQIWCDGGVLSDRGPLGSKSQGCPNGFPAIGLLLDGGGANDDYQDAPCPIANGLDRTAVKGIIGFQIDVPAPPNTPVPTVAARCDGDLPP